MSADVWRVEFSTVDGLPPRKIRVTCADVAQWDYIEVHEAMRRTDEAVAAALELKRWRREDPAMFEHCQRGGLVLAPLSKATRSDEPQVGGAS